MVLKMAWTKDEMCKITAELEMREGLYVNLGIGIPTGVPNFIPKNVRVISESENGMLGVGPFPYPGEEDSDLTNASKQTITAIPESSYLDSATSFVLIRGGHIDVSILGALQVSKNGDLANWTIPGKLMKGMGGAMDLVANVQRIVILMDHVDPKGMPKLLDQCTLPLTGVNVVDRVITNLGVFDITQDGIKLVTKAHDVSLDEIRSKTGTAIIL